MWAIVLAGKPARIARAALAKERNFEGREEIVHESPGKDGIDCR